MISTAEKEITFTELALISQGHAAFQLLWAGVNLEVFDFLSRSPNSNFERLLQKTGLNEQPAKILINGLLTLGLIVKSDGSFSNSDIVNQTMVRSKPNNLVNVLGWQYHIVYPGLFHFLSSLKEDTNKGLECFKGEGDNLYSRLTEQKELENIFQDAMASLSSSSNKILKKHLDLKGVKHLVDAGGGNGENGMVLARENKGLNITIFDSTSVCENALKNIQKSGFSDQIQVHPGNLFSDPFPKEVDAILFAHMLTIWSAENNIKLLKRAFNALEKGGCVIIFNMMANDNGYGPMSAALGSPYFLSIATGEGMLYSWSDYKRFLKEAGFRNICSTPLEKDHGLIVGYKV